MNASHFRFWRMGVLAAVLSVSCPHAARAINTNDVHYQALKAYVEDPSVPAWKHEYPSANTCKPCHPVHYRQWSVSPHSYAQMSPVFNAMNATIFKRTNGSNGDFCIRCHTPVGMNRNEAIFMSNIDRHPTSREGITCIVCHRVSESYGKVSGRLPIETGNLIEVAVSTRVAEGGEETFDSERAKENLLGLSTDQETASGQKLHEGAVEKFFFTEPSLCGTCHDVLLMNGFRLEEAFSEYKRSPAAKDGITCQDCHMGIHHGKFVGDPNGDKASNYEFAPIAEVNGVKTPPRKRTNHMFPGPDHSVIHPGIFPHNDRAVRDQREDPATATGLATIRDWLKFDHLAGWGEREFEIEERNRVSQGGKETPFPEPWTTRASRIKARKILDDQFALMNEYREAQAEVLKEGYVLAEHVVEQADSNGIKFKVKVRNGTDGHGVPTGFIGERVVFLKVTVLDVGGNLVFASGDLDPNGDVRDLHSAYVHNGELPLDDQLFTLQSRFLTTTVRGGEREVILPIPVSLTPQPFVRPQGNASTLVGRPSTARIHKNNIMPGDHRWAEYEVPGSALTGNGPYTAHIKFISGMVPINLVNEIKDVGFDYDMSARDIAEGVLAGHRILWERTITFDIP